MLAFGVKMKILILSFIAILNSALAMQSPPEKIVTSTGSEYILIKGLPEKLGISYQDRHGTIWGQGVLNEAGEPLLADFETANAYCESIVIDGVNAKLPSSDQWTNVLNSMGAMIGISIVFDTNNPDNTCVAEVPDTGMYRCIGYDTSKPALLDLDFAANFSEQIRFINPKMQIGYPTYWISDEVSKYTSIWAYSIVEPLSYLVVNNKVNGGKNFKLPFRCSWSKN